MKYYSVSCIENLRPELGQFTHLSIQIFDFFRKFRPSHLPGIHHTFRFNEKYGNLLAILCPRTMLNTLWHDKQLIRAQYYISPIFGMKLNDERAREDNEKLVCVFMRMSHEAVGHFDDFDVIVIQRGYAFGRPVVSEEGECMSEINRLV